ncbi:MAG TPA: isoprenylcysteine carboxylmethyltransferase family protein [Candidatus Acidoferrales bacterium]|nr:isoprenylcysteine carboxylmethyltransferase family protein [Candidatus Acidoferrales bacterium]
MIVLRILAGIVFFMQLPVPLYWFVLHPGMRYWRGHRKAGYIVALACSWLPVTVCLIVFRSALFSGARPSAPSIILGLGMIAFEAWVFTRVRRDLGDARLVGHTELLGGGEIANRGVYARIRHPRYLASFLALVGACLLAATCLMWTIAAIWTVLTFAAILMEEREMRARFGASYEVYARRVPRFLPSFIRARN